MGSTMGRSRMTRVVCDARGPPISTWWVTCRKGDTPRRGRGGSPAGIACVGAGSGLTRMERRTCRRELSSLVACPASNRRFTFATCVPRDKDSTNRRKVPLARRSPRAASANATYQSHVVSETALLSEQPGRFNMHERGIQRYASGNCDPSDLETCRRFPKITDRDRSSNATRGRLRLPESPRAPTC